MIIYKLNFTILKQILVIKFAKERIMLDFAKEKSLWDNIRTSEDFARHREEIAKKYEDSFKIAPSAHTVEEILGKDDHGKWARSLNQLQSSALMSLIYPDNDEYYDNLLRIIWAYLDTYTWAPLGHYNGYYDRTPDDYDIGLIDIFASSVAFSLAEIKNLFSDRLPQLIKDRISAELRRRTIEPFVNRKYFWEKHPNNWSSVCAGGVGGVLMYEDPELYMEQRERLDSAMQVYIDSYADDGVCVEGAAYWGFGFGFFVSYAMLQRELTNGEYDWFKNPKVKAIATFIQKMLLQTNVVASFSDCNPRENYWIGLPHILRDIYGDEVEKLPKTSGTIIEYTHFNFSLRSLIYYKPEYAVDKVAENVTYNMESTGYFTKRTKHYGFAAKGGNNGESHNHNDVGSFILAKDDKQILCDIGAGAYCDGYHGNQRYTFFHPSSFSHNLPFFDGVGQDGYRREDVKIEYIPHENTIYMDFTRGYGIDYLEKAERMFYFTDSVVTLNDRFTLKKDSVITERFVTKIKPKLLGKHVILDGVKISPVNNIVPTITLEKHPGHLANTIDEVYCIDYVLEGETEFTVDFFC